jgi:DNA-binding CsgD family transcriptional regulator
MATVPIQAALPAPEAGPLPTSVCPLRRAATETPLLLVGRAFEQAAIDQLLDKVRLGLSGSLLLRGDAGIGKSALLEYAMRSAAAQMRIAKVVGVECEVELEFAGLHQLVRPFVARLPGLPAPQRRALSATFGEVDGPAPDRFLVGLAVLTLLAEAANDEPILCVVDDAQWVDRASAEVLAFVARRCEADRLGLLFAMREPADRLVSLDGLPSLTVQGLDVGDSRQLLASLSMRAMDAGVEYQLAVRAAGNPLALVELSRDLTDEQLAGTTWLPDPLPLAADMQTRFVRQIAALPPEVRTLLLLAAAEPSSALDLFERVADILGIGDAVRDRQSWADLLELDTHVTFRHPLIRSAAYPGASVAARRRVHAAIAAASDPDTDPDLVAWHRAAASSGPDESVAAALERSADRASSRGGVASSAAFLRRAAELTPQPARRVERLLDAAAAEFRAGGTARAVALLDRAEADLAHDATRATALHLRGQIQLSLGESGQATTTLLRAARLLMPIEPSRAREVLLDALNATIYAGPGARAQAVEAVRELAGPEPKHPNLADRLLHGLATVWTGDSEGGATGLRAAISSLLDGDVNEGAELRWLGLGMVAACELLDMDARRRMAERWVALSRASGVLSTLPLALDLLGTWQASSGDLDQAESSNAEARDILAATGNPDMLGTRAVEVLAPVWRGEGQTARSKAAALIAHCTERDQLGAVSLAQYALTVLELSECNYPAAVALARPLLAENRPAFSALVLPEVIEAAAHCGEHEVAVQALGRLRERARAGDNDLAWGLLARCQALVSLGENVEALFVEAVARLQRSGIASEIARTHLLYGEWLRRQRRRADARTQLRTAHEMFDRMGARAFAARAWSELSATGEKARRRDGMSATALTIRETQIVELVMKGGTNAEIAAQLFISPSTVEYHLRNMFQKVGVSSRTKLVAALRAQDGTS